MYAHTSMKMKNNNKCIYFSKIMFFCDSLDTVLLDRCTLYVCMYVYI